MKKGYLFLIALALAALACEVPSAKAPTLTNQGPRRSLRTAPTLTNGIEAVCAVVTAKKALNVRAGVGTTSRILFHLKHGDHVLVEDKSDPDWWLVSYNGQTGTIRHQSARSDRGCNCRASHALRQERPGHDENRIQQSGRASICANFGRSEIAFSGARRSGK